MNSADLATAVELARAAAGVGAGTPASTVVVRRLDRDGEYVLVQLGAPGSAGWIAAVNVADNDVMSWAANPSGESTVPEAHRPTRPSTSGGPPRSADHRSTRCCG